MSHVKEVLWKLLILITYSYEAFKLSTVNPHNISFLGRGGFNYSSHLQVRRLRLWFCHSPRLTWLIRSTQGIWRRHFDFRMWVIGTTWLDSSLFLSRHVEKNACRFFDALKSSGQSARTFVCGNASPPLIQTASFSFCRAIDERTLPLVL